MVIKKLDVLDMVAQLPDEFDVEQLMHKLYLKAKLERAEEAIARGEVLSHEEVVENFKRWFK